MESKIPVPTDNIFKFYALFGLLLFVFAFGSVLFVNRTSNELIYAVVPELEGLKQIAKPTPVDAAKIALLQKKLEINKADKDAEIKLLGGLGGVAFLMMLIGFWNWHSKIQPVIDETAKVQLEIAKLQLEKLRRELAPPAATPPVAEKVPPEIGL